MNKNICTILEQRRQLALLRKPANRYEGLANPYNGVFTKEQLDMRRKAEILQYKKSSSNTGQMTKLGKYAKLFNVSGNNNICPLDIYLPTQSSSSDVPGPIVTLQYDDSVPLYNYASDADNYANLTPDANAPFQLYAENNILIANNSTTSVASLIINNPSTSSSSFAVSIPIGIYSSASVSGSSVYIARFVISSLTFGVYYNGTLVPGTQQTYTNFSNKFVRITSNSLNTVFSGALYLGCITKTVTLPTQKGFVYEFRISAQTDLVSQSECDYTNRVFGTFANISSNLSPINSSIVLASGGPLSPIVNPGKITVT